MPTLYLDLFHIHLTERLDERLGQTGIRHQRYVVVDSVATDTVTVRQFTLGLVFRDIDNQIELMLGYHRQHVVLGSRMLVGPVHGYRFHPLSFKKRAVPSVA